MFNQGYNPLPLSNTRLKKTAPSPYMVKESTRKPKTSSIPLYFHDGTVSGLEKTTEWTAPDAEGSYELKLIIEDEDQQTDTAVIIIDVVSEINMLLRSSL